MYFFLAAFLLPLLTAKTIAHPDPYGITGTQKTIQVISYEQKHFMSALFACHTLGMEMVSINNPQEEEHLNSVLAAAGLDTSNVWLGGTDVGNGQFYWISTGRPIIYKNWNPNQPVKSGCIVRMGTFPAKWSNVACNTPTYFACEKYL